MAQLEESDDGMLYLRLTKKSVYETIEVWSGIQVDLDEYGLVVGVEVFC